MERMTLSILAAGLQFCLLLCGFPVYETEKRRLGMLPLAIPKPAEK